MSQRTKVIHLYKTLLYMGRDYPKGYQYFRTKLKRAFDKNKTETDPEKIDKMINHESPKMAACVAVIGKDNSPKFIKIYQCTDEAAGLQFHYKVHTSIDIIEEKLNVGNKTTVDIRDLYLGLLFATEEYKIYGYATNTKIKFVIVLQSSNVSLRDNEIKMIFKKLHAAYSNAVCNPFYIPGDEIKSKSFDTSVLEIMGVI
ncbi:PREDICTED: trafficking protein particle complex subunit 2-like protein isoform X1 [Cyphomyrmex costatus]|uniref:trafficking protein particle complex subunit 2-like protein isoform X1 n=2 Tax=Cyphomyrmex costatus TaxID=456900 RepID=UPI000852437C|nr:PREDICTED: trafficking protein particle complex subunit 2-like protein isoform X1 [Cyphomyrmex costatus]